MHAGGWIVPGLVDAHCHIGLDQHGGVDREIQEQQAIADREAGALLVRDAGSPVDTRWIDDREDLPKIIRAGRHIARSKRYIRNYGWEIEPDELVAYVEQEARRGDGWVKLVGDWIDRDAGDLTPCWPAEALNAAIARAHELGARVTAHVFGEHALPDLLAAGIDCLEHGTGVEPDMLDEMAAARRRRRTHARSSSRTSRSTPIRPPASSRSYAGHMRDLYERRLDTGCGTRSRPACPCTPGPTRAASSDTAWSRRRSRRSPRSACPASRRLLPDRGRPATGSARPASCAPAIRPISSCTTRTRARIPPY